MLRKSGLRERHRSREEVNPMEGIANLVDVMLVFACGLMVSIILYWKIDINQNVQTITQDNLREVGNLQEAVQNGSLKDSYEDKGTVYQDPETGKMYVVTRQEP